MDWHSVENICWIALLGLRKDLMFDERQPFEHPGRHSQIVATQNICKSRLPEAIRKSSKMRVVFIHCRIYAHAGFHALNRRHFGWPTRACALKETKLNLTLFQVVLVDMNM
jgi:hypothetical protein